LTGNGCLDFAKATIVRKFDFFYLLRVISKGFHFSYNEFNRFYLGLSKKTKFKGKRYQQ